MLELIGGAELWQWDTSRQIDCAGLQAGAKVQFAYSDTQTLSTAVKTADGASVADVPNQLLLRSGALMVYAYVTEADGVSYTKYAARFNVQARPKPDDYVYTPTEVQSWQTIHNEIGDLDDLTTTAKNNLVAAINEAAASGGGGGGSVTKDSIVTALGYTPEDAANKTTALSASSTVAEYPSAKAVWDAIPHPEAKTAAMTQAVGKDADGKLWTAPGGGGSSSGIELVYTWTADGTTMSAINDLTIEPGKLYFCETIVPSNGDLTANVTTPAVNVRIGSEGNTYTGMIVGTAKGQQKYSVMQSRWTFLCSMGRFTQCRTGHKTPKTSHKMQNTKQTKYTSTPQHPTSTSSAGQPSTFTKWGE